MLENLISVINFFKTTFYYGLYISYKTGFFLVTSINTIFKYLIVVLDNFMNFISVLCESFVIFMQDIYQCIQQIVLLVTAFAETIYSSVAAVYLKVSLYVSSILTVISSVYNALVNGITTVIGCIGQTIVFLRNLVVLFGSGVWFLITLVPLLLYYFCSLCISFSYSIYKEICDICYSGVFNVKTLIKNIILFIIDVPIESIAGIIIALSLAYIFNQFSVMIISYFKQQLRKFRNWIRHLQITEIFSNYLSIFPRQLPRQQQIQTPMARQPVRQVLTVQARTPVRTRQRGREKQDNSPPPEEKYCVICQERNKCILLLPCRHLCLCSECIAELRYYNEVCPICRTNIESTMKIFV